jgi:hypothetical protein
MEATGASLPVAGATQDTTPLESRNVDVYKGPEEVEDVSGTAASPEKAKKASRFAKLRESFFGPSRKTPKKGDSAVLSTSMDTSAAEEVAVQEPSRGMSTGEKVVAGVAGATALTAVGVGVNASQQDEPAYAVRCTSFPLYCRVSL